MQKHDQAIKDAVLQAFEPSHAKIANHLAAGEHAEANAAFTAAAQAVISNVTATLHAEQGVEQAAEAEPETVDPNTHTLDTPLVRGKQTITEITLRKPTSGELRGVSLSDLVSLDVVALSKVLPRISSPTLTEQDVARIDPADLVQLGGIFAGFLMPKAVKASMASLSA